MTSTDTTTVVGSLTRKPLDEELDVFGLRSTRALYSARSWPGGIAYCTACSSAYRSTSPKLGRCPSIAPIADRYRTERQS